LNIITSTISKSLLKALNTLSANRAIFTVPSQIKCTFIAGEGMITRLVNGILFVRTAYSTNA